MRRHSTLALCCVLASRRPSVSPRWRAQANLFNALNANPVLTEGTALGSNVAIAPYLSTDPNTGGTPLSILQPRLIQIGAQIRF